ncbi:CehA/McbA family metallohydrolase [Devosia sp. MC521]|uniref:CehA/McbA family metallohydrolase n=1 Tax=Devosia sp. MC521 TaxID=2759954 RepID=UPI0015F93EFB|nr:CehA/McbA family metallohydrolase [Devosia sp. MC521]MBJ6985777.1 CehA/McbA family metallohydrolase [Devosia sp. MC521]QMW61157.1 CehA/McbA family metallohydrolase [Devosia sp. MC521]
MLTITHHITRADQERNPYYYIPYEVPAATSRIDVTLAYAKAEDAIIDLGAFDPRDTGYPTAAGFRGWSGGARDTYFIATDDATPGYIHGTIQPGTWTVVLGLYKVPLAGLDVTVTITLDSSARPHAPQPARSFPVRQGAGWYRGDLHCHTFHSDARGAPELLHAAAKQAGLDFLAIADHNTITQRRYFHPQSSPELVFIRGMEITTAVGHANVFGVDEWIDFRMTKPSDAHVLAKLVHDKGGLLSINHDKPTIPWDYDFPAADCQEVWQSTWLAWNWVALEKYQKRLASGLKLSAIGGSDFHQPDRLMPEGPLVLARPTTVFYLPELSENAVLAAMKSGYGYVTESPTGPHLELRAGDSVMGGTCDAISEIEVTIRGAAGDTLSLIDASGEIASVTIESDAWNATLSVSPKMFIRAEIIAKASRADLIETFKAALDGKELPWQLKGTDLESQPIRRALSNPIYLAR